MSRCLASGVGRSVVVAAALAMVAAGCREGGGPPRTGSAGEARIFDILSPSATGVAFRNELPDDTTFTALDYLYYYNGGGVAVGDIDNDGLPDLYFTSSRGANRLYRNLGDYRFEDITARAGVADSVGWKTGVTMADVDGDGYVDIYVSGVDYMSMRGRNVLFLNNRDGTFSDRTTQFGLDYAGFSTQALFFDYDNDGDLDMYLLNHATHRDRRPAGSGRSALKERSERLGDRLYRNDGGRFTDVSAQAGIYGGIDFGLGVVASDLNGDGCVDLYVGNDFQEDDLLYYNNCDGTFTEDLGASMAHTSQFSMGVDAADFNNDLRPDLVTADMLPNREAILKASANVESLDLFNLKVAAGYHPQYSRNTLQLNRGRGSPARGGLSNRESARPLFSDVAYLAGVYATDWSWAPLFADLDNDGRKDLFISDGIYRRPNDRDYIAYISDPAVQAALALGGGEDLRVIERMPHIAQPNHVFRNHGDLRFEDVTQRWGMAEPGFSNGAVYVDLNNSGALDLVINRINAPAAIYRNRIRERNPTNAHSLRVSLRGSAARKNSQGLGARVLVNFAGGRGGTWQVLEQLPTRGFQSSVDPRLHFGLGAATRVDSLVVIWPDRRFQVLTGVRADTAITLSQDSASGNWYAGRRGEGGVGAEGAWFSDITKTAGIDFEHHETAVEDFNREPLLPRALSTEGPALAVGDVNGDSLDDVYVGGARWQGGRLYVQRPDGTFRVAPSAALQADSLSEDVDAVFFDADGDGDLDLYVVSGGHELGETEDAIQDRLYLNDGKAGFTRSRDGIPQLAEGGSHVAAGDFDGDGRVDLFVGRRAVNRRYGEIPRSYLLVNDGAGHFRDVTPQVAPELERVGMVTSASWLDYDGDGHLDLVVVGDWMPVRVFHNEGSPSAAGRRSLIERSKELGLAGTEGWWNAVRVADLDGDGRPDLILGNLGKNSYIRASKAEPVELHVGDFAQSGSLQQILTAYKEGVSYPIAGRDEMIRAIPSLRSRFPTYASFGASRIQDLIPQSELRRGTTLDARTLASSVAINRKDGTFELRELPALAQLAPIYGIVADDFNSDRRTDVLVAGNFYGVTPMLGRYDASYGLLLAGGGGRAGSTNDAAGLMPVEMDESRVFIEGQARRMELIRSGRGRGERLIVIAKNNAKVQVLQVQRVQRTIH